MKRGRLRARRTVERAGTRWRSNLARIGQAAGGVFGAVRRSILNRAQAEMHEFTAAGPVPTLRRLRLPRPSPKHPWARACHHQAKETLALPTTERSAIWIASGGDGTRSQYGATRRATDRSRRTRLSGCDPRQGGLAFLQTIKSQMVSAFALKPMTLAPPRFPCPADVQRTIWQPPLPRPTGPRPPAPAPASHLPCNAPGAHRRSATDAASRCRATGARRHASRSHARLPAVARR